MTISVEKKDGLCKMKVETDMTIFNAAELKNDLLYDLGDCSALEIDLSKVSEIDTSGFQLLFMMKREAVLRNRDFKIASHSPATSAVINLYNMSDYFSAKG